ncbi:V-set domain containing T cell activation inhibitor 1, partial [Chelydra serpentina]
ASSDPAIGQGAGDRVGMGLVLGYAHPSPLPPTGPTIALLLLTQLSSLRGLGTDKLPVELSATSEAVLGDTALLNCTYPPEADLILYWTRLGPDSERNVYTYYRGEHLALHDDPAYRGRATVLAGQPGRGHGALRIHNVTLADEGRYRCRVKSNRGMGVAETELRLI